MFVSSILNPTTLSYCGIIQETALYAKYEIQTVNMQNNEILSSNFFVLDGDNCIEFTVGLYDV